MESPTLPVTVPPAQVIIHNDLNEFIHDGLTRDYASLAMRYAAWNTRALAFNDTFSSKALDDGSADAAQGLAEQAWLVQEADDYEDLLVHFELSFLKLQVDEQQYILAMNAMAKRLGFTEDKLKSVDLTLRRLALKRDEAKNLKETRTQIWRDIRARAGDSELIRAAKAGDGPTLFPAAGEQSFQDCTIFALSNATGEPYGVVAARANRLLADAEWRGAADQSDPQRVLKEQGLNGGEMVLMAEIFGTSEVVTRNDFPAVIAGGRPILACIVTVGENGRSGRHQVVLTKTFTHQGETWYEMMDSGSQQPRHVRDAELAALLFENGVVFTHDASRIPRIPGAGDAPVP